MSMMLAEAGENKTIAARRRLNRVELLASGVQLSLSFLFILSVCSLLTLNCLEVG
jgi:hypothetical protein